VMNPGPSTAMNRSIRVLQRLSIEERQSRMKFQKVAH